jgi:hypothetical protein
MHRLHVVTLLTDMRPAADAHFLSDALLAVVSASLIDFQLREHHFDVDRVKDGIDDLLRLL